MYITMGTAVYGYISYEFLGHFVHKLDFLQNSGRSMCVILSTPELDMDIALVASYYCMFLMI